jgi:hypothetical protein
VIAEFHEARRISQRAAPRRHGHEGWATATPVSLATGQTIPSLPPRLDGRHLDEKAMAERVCTAFEDSEALQLEERFPLQRGASEHAELLTAPRSRASGGRAAG